VNKNQKRVIFSGFWVIIKNVYKNEAFFKDNDVIQEKQCNILND